MHMGTDYDTMMTVKSAGHGNQKVSRIRQLVTEIWTRGKYGRIHCKPPRYKIHAEPNHHRWNMKSKHNQYFHP